MFQVIFAALLLSAIILPFPLLALAERKQKRRALSVLLREFSLAGSRNGLSFSSQEVIGNVVIGLDGLQRKLLVVEQKDKGVYHSVVIDLNDVKACSVSKQYQQISRDGLQAPEDVVQSIALVFDVAHNLPSDVVFYNRTDDHTARAPEMESKAKHWQVMLTKLQMPLKKQLTG